MQKLHKRLNHGYHNEEAGDYLELKRDKFADWIIIAAFYSALHFVTYKIFPFKVRRADGTQQLISNISQYATYQREINKNNKLSKHALLATLVSEKCSDISLDYEELLELSYNARYRNYRFAPEVRNEARALMKKIKDFCTQEETAPKKY